MVLINPAIEAIHYASFRDIVEEKERKGELEFLPGQKPRLIIATSEGDEATKYAFPLGRKLSTFFESYNVIKRENRYGREEPFFQAEMDDHTIGHYRGFITHRLEVDGHFDLNLDDCDLSKSRTNKVAEGSLLYEGWKDILGFGEGEKYKMTLRHLNNSSAYNPYWIVKLVDEVIPDHNNILRGNFVCFVREYLPNDYLR